MQTGITETIVVFSQGNNEGLASVWQSGTLIDDEDELLPRIPFRLKIVFILSKFKLSIN